MEPLIKKKILELLKKLKEASAVYQNCNNDQKIRLFDSCKTILDKLEEFGYNRLFAEGLLVGGKDFLNGEKEATAKETELIFAGIVEDLTEEDREKLVKAETFKGAVAERPEQGILPT